MCEGLTIGVDVVDELADLLRLGVHAKGLHGNLQKSPEGGFTFGLKPFSVLCFPCSRPTGVRSRVVGWRRNGVQRAGAGGP